MLLVGIGALVVSDFSFTRSKEEASLGPISVSVKEKETVQVPTWAAAAAILLGAGLAVGGGRKAR